MLLSGTGSSNTTTSGLNVVGGVSRQYIAHVVLKTVVEAPPGVVLLCRSHPFEEQLAAVLKPLIRHLSLMCSCRTFKHFVE